MTAPIQWYRFVCVSCGWETVGCYDFTKPLADTVLPDTDCPKCGSHDGVRDTEEQVPAPEDPDAVKKDQNTGPFAR